MEERGLAAATIDRFAGLSADLARNVRTEIRSVMSDNTYREVAVEVDREEAWS